MEQALSALLTSALQELVLILVHVLTLHMMILSLVLQSKVIYDIVSAR